MDKVPNKERTKTYFVFIDIAKAFDSLPRTRLLNKLINIGLDKSIIQIIEDLLTDTQMQMNNERIKINRGTP